MKATQTPPNNPLPNAHLPPHLVGPGRSVIRGSFGQVLHHAPDKGTPILLVIALTRTIGGSTATYIVGVRLCYPTRGLGISSNGDPLMRRSVVGGQRRCPRRSLSGGHLLSER